MHPEETWRLSVPANSSRFFDTATAAQQQPVAAVDLGWSVDDPYLFNRAFDPALIRHDDAYYTVVADLSGATQIPTLGYLDRVLRHVPAGAEIVDIGCGQGELVHALRDRGLRAVGFDPALRSPGPGLIDRYWVPGDGRGAGLFVMRCVLPHIADPWTWVRRLGDEHPGALLLVEFQRLEWMAENAVWYQLSHDHVNLFRVRDFADRFEVVDAGEFADGEWAWVLFRPDTYRQPEPRDCDVVPLVDELLEARTRLLAELAGRSVALWGAAGKGIVLAHALTEAGADVRYAIDAGSGRWGLFMEVSGVPVVSPDDGVAQLDESSLVVCNPNHRAAVTEYLAQAHRSGTVPVLPATGWPMR